MFKNLNNIANTRLLTQAYENESKRRAEWILKHREKLELAATLHREPTNYYEEDVVKHVMVAGLPALTRDFIATADNRRNVPFRDVATILGAKNIRHENTILTMGLGDPKEDPRLARPDTDLSLDPIMRPVDCKIKRLLQKPKPNFGREVYLKKRADLWPEKKYYFPECSSWDYGWRTHDSGKQRQPEFGRRWYLNRTLRSRVGPQPDPVYYNSADIPGNTKCVSA